MHYLICSSSSMHGRVGFGLVLIVQKSGGCGRGRSRGGEGGGKCNGLGECYGRGRCLCDEDNECLKKKKRDMPL